MTRDALAGLLVLALLTLAVRWLEALALWWGAG